MKTQHTPGHWFVGEPIRNPDCIGIVTVWSDGGETGEETIAEVLPTLADGNETAKWQARLIAAAPELLRELKRLLEYYRHGELRPEALGKLIAAAAAIKKAEGTE